MVEIERQFALQRSRNFERERSDGFELLVSEDAPPHEAIKGHLQKVRGRQEVLNVRCSCLRGVFRLAQPRCDRLLGDAKPACELDL